MPVVPHLVSLVTSGDLDGVDGLLRSLAADDRAEARRWFEGSRRWFAEQHDITGNSPGLAFEVYWAQFWIEGICAVTLCSPIAAARRVPWGHLWSSQDDVGEPHVVHQLWDADREWVATFIDAASRVGLGNNARFANLTLSLVLRAAAVHHALPCPAGATFLRASVTGSHGDLLSDRLRDDPLMPDLFFHYLASGHSGDHADFPAAARTLIAEGLLGRDRVLAAVLEQLTTSQRVASQRVLAGLLDAVEVSAPEIPGGLTYLLGVLSTSDGSVGRRVLPLALDLVEDAAGLHELTGVIAARPERKQKEMLLRALTTPALITGVGEAAAIEALRALAEGNDDATFVAKINRARARLGETRVEAAESAAVPLGLWALSPQARPPHEVQVRDWWRESRQESLELMLRPTWVGHGDVEVWVVNHLLNDMAQGSFDPEALRSLALRLLTGAQLSVPGLCRLFEELFLAGGMSRTWAVALSIADAACAGARRPARFDVLLRMLVRYAAEAPRTAVPGQIETLAAGRGSSKAEEEARALGATLSGESTQTYLTRIRRNVAGTRTVAVRGLWREALPGDTRPGDRRLPPPGEVSLERFLGAAATALDHRYRYVRDIIQDGPLVDPDLLLRDAIAAARQHGVDRVRSGLLALEKQQYDFTPIRSALDLWAGGGLTVAVFWKLALRARTHHDVLEQWRDDPAVGQEKAWELSRQLPALDEQIKNDVPILPRTLDSRAARLTFLRACEALLMIEHAPVLLSTPTYQDGTLDFDDLRVRLAGCVQVVGPLDLVQALYRLRPTDPARAAELERMPVGVVAQMCAPDTPIGDADADVGWDAPDLVRTWVAAGGLPPLSARPSADGQSWSFDAEVPVPWSRCLAAPIRVPVLDDYMTHAGDSGGVARVFPLWPDRVLDTPYLALTWQEPSTAAGIATLGGDFGVAAHDYFLATLAQQNPHRRSECVAVFLELLRYDRLDPDRAAKAAVGRAAAGTLALSTSIKSWEEIFRAGGLRAMWPLVLEIASALAGVSPRPSGLPALLRLLTHYVHEVPAPVIPDGIRQLAAAAGAARSQVEARALIDAATSIAGARTR